MLAYQSPQILQALGADIIYDDGNGTMYVCALDATFINKSSKSSLLEQPIWQIKRIQEVSEGGMTVTTIQYPNGRNSYAFKASEILSYDYQFSI